MQTRLMRTVVVVGTLVVMGTALRASAADYATADALFTDIGKVIDKKVGPPTEKLTDQTLRQAQAAANACQGRTVRFKLTFEAIGRSGVIHVKEKQPLSYKGERTKFTGTIRFDAADKNQWAKFKPGDTVYIEGRVGLTTTHKQGKTWDLILAVQQCKPGKA